MTRYAPLTTRPNQTAQAIANQRDVAFGRTLDKAADVRPNVPNLAAGVGEAHSNAALNAAMQQMLHLQALQHLASLYPSPYSSLAAQAQRLANQPSALTTISNGMQTQAQQIANQPSANTTMANGLTAQAQRLANQPSPASFQQFLQQLATQRS